MGIKESFFPILFAIIVSAMSTLLVMMALILIKAENTYTYTRIVCSIPENNVSYCQDAIVSCKGNKVISIKLIGKPVNMNYTESPLGWC
jgi:hypothetical protein